MKMIYVVALICAMLTSLISHGTAEAAKKQKPALSKKSIVLKKGKKVTLSLKKASRRVKWTTSDKNIVAIKSRKGKKKQTVNLVAKKSGKCRITAKVGKKKWMCSVLVQSNLSAQNTIGVRVLNATATEKSIRVETEFFNHSPSQASYGLSFRIEKYTDGKWTIVESKEDMIFPAVACLIPMEKSVRQSFTIRETKETLTNGLYRIVTSMQSSKNAKCTSTAEFTVNNL